MTKHQLNNLILTLIICASVGLSVVATYYKTFILKETEVIDTEEESI